MTVVTYQDIMMEAELAAAYLHSYEKSDTDNTPLNYTEYAWLMDMLIKVNKETAERWRYKKNMEKSKEEIANDIITIINNLRYHSVSEETKIQNDMADTIIRHIEYYKKGEFDEWLKNRNMTG